MNQGYDLVVFDWDGTLLDSAAAIVRAMRAACVEHGLPDPGEAAARYVIGLGLEDTLRHVAPSLPVAEYGELTLRYRTHYLGSDNTLSLFDGVPEMLQALAARGRTLAVATGKSRVGLTRAFAHSGLGPLFMASRTADECFSKPHPQMLEELMDELGAAPTRTLMIGDTTHDLQMARNAGVDAVGVTFGAHRRNQLETVGARVLCDTPAELHRWLQLHA